MTLWPKFFVILLITLLFESWDANASDAYKKFHRRNVATRGTCKERKGVAVESGGASSGQLRGRTRSTTSYASPRPRCPPAFGSRLFSIGQWSIEITRWPPLQIASRLRRVFSPRVLDKRDLYLFLNDGSETVSSSSDVSSRERRSCVRTLRRTSNFVSYSWQA